MLSSTRFPTGTKPQESHKSLLKSPHFSARNLDSDTMTTEQWFHCQYVYNCVTTQLISALICLYHWFCLLLCRYLKVGRILKRKYLVVCQQFIFVRLCPIMQSNCVVNKLLTLKAKHSTVKAKERATLKAKTWNVSLRMVSEKN